MNFFSISFLFLGKKQTGSSTYKIGSYKKKSMYPKSEERRVEHRLSGGTGEVTRQHSGESLEKFNGFGVPSHNLRE